MQTVGGAGAWGSWEAGRPRGGVGRALEGIRAVLQASWHQRHASHGHPLAPLLPGYNCEITLFCRSGLRGSNDTGFPIKPVYRSLSGFLQVGQLLWQVEGVRLTGGTVL